MSAGKTTEQQAAAGFRPGLFWTAVAALCLTIVVGATIFSRALSHKFPPSQSPLPHLHTVAFDLEATERTGRRVRMSELKGKVHTIAYLYTVCPHGCAAIISEMLKLQRAHGSRGDFHQVSVSVLPEHDTTEMLAAYARGIGLEDSAPWWFLTGEQSQLWAFMTEGLKLEPSAAIPKEEQLNPLDTHSHDLRIVLLDRTGCVRGYYAVNHPQPEIAQLMKDRLQSDVQRLLDDPAL